MALFPRSPCTREATFKGVSLALWIYNHSTLIAFYSAQQHHLSFLKSKSPFLKSSTSQSSLFSLRKNIMISPKKLIRMARKWQKVAAMGRKRISLPSPSRYVETKSCSTSSVADKCHFVVYTANQKRFVIPLVYLSSNIFIELFKMSEEEFGLPNDGPITLPCDEFFMEYILMVIQRGAVNGLEKALLMSIATSPCSSSSSFQLGQTNQQLLVY